MAAEVDVVSENQKKIEDGGLEVASIDAFVSHFTRIDFRITCPAIFTHGRWR